MAELKKTLGLAECIFFGVGSILGAGIYTLIGKVAGWSGNFIWLSFAIASFTALCTAFSYAELSAAFPKAGGEYIYAQKAFGRKTGFFLGSVISINGIVSGATVSIGFAGYLNELVGLGTLLSAFGIIGLIFLVNVSGVRQSSVINIIFTVIEISGLVFVIIAAWPAIGQVDYFELPGQGTHGIIVAAALAFYAYIGFEDIVKLAEETKDPGKIIPKALFITCAIVIGVYCLVAVAAVSAVPHEQLAKSASPLADVVSSRFGKTGIVVISIIALFSTSNTILSNMLGSSRVLLEMGKESRIFKPLAYVSTKRKTPVGALVLILVVMCAFALIGNIETIAQIATVFIFVTFMVVNLSVIVLRFKMPEQERPYRIPWTIGKIPVFSLLGMAMTLVLLAYNFISLAGD
jgi:APA family basic amino acid/polyamine antiporter